VIGGLAIYGGTFDPIHVGHLRSAIEVKALLNVADLRMVPSYIPPHRDQPGASPKARRAMLDLAIAGLAGITVDDRELRREGKSYAIDTLAELRREVGPTRPLFFILGEDAFALIHTWHRWTELTDYAHFVVLKRPFQAETLKDPVLEWLQRKETAELSTLNAEPAGRVVTVKLAQWEVSATDIRHRIRSAQSIDFLVPAAVQNYVVEQHLYE
jgi:nicotinate-nucleotide adenylyltransferase